MNSRHLNLLDFGLKLSGKTHEKNCLKLVKIKIGCLISLN